MSSFLLLLSIILSGALIFPVTSIGHEYQLGAIQVLHPWALPTPPGARLGAGYLTIVNKGTTPIRFMGGSTPAAARIEVHSMTMDGVVMRMRPLPAGMTIPAYGKIELKPGGTHLMLVELRRPLIKSEHVPVTLLFSGGVKIEAMLAIEVPASPAGHQGH